MLVPKLCNVEVLPKCEKEAKQRFGYESSADSTCCVHRHALDCQLAYWRKHCSQHDFLRELLELKHRTQLDRLEARCGAIQTPCGRDPAGVWFTLLMVLVGAIVLSSLCIIVTIYFTG